MGRLAIQGGACGLLRIGRGGGEYEFSDLGEKPATAGGKQPIGADLVEALGEYVLKEAAHELQGRECDGLPASLAGVFVAEGYGVVVGGKDAVVGDGNPVDVAGEIDEDFFRRLNRGLAVDDPRGVPH